MVPCKKVSVRTMEDKKIEVSCYKSVEDGLRKETGFAELLETCG